MLSLPCNGQPVSGRADSEPCTYLAFGSLGPGLLLRFPSWPRTASPFMPLSRRAVPLHCSRRFDTQAKMPGRRQEQRNLKTFSGLGPHDSCRDPSTSYRCPTDQGLHVPISENERDLGADVRCLAQADRLVAVSPLAGQPRAEGSTLAGRVGPGRRSPLQPAIRRQPNLVMMREVPNGIVSGLLFPNALAAFAPIQAKRLASSRV